MKQNKFSHVLLCVLVVCHLKNTHYANMSYRINPFSRNETKKKIKSKSDNDWWYFIGNSDAEIKIPSLNSGY